MYLNRVNITKVMYLKLNLIYNLALRLSNCTLKNNNSTDKLSNTIMLEFSGGSRKDKSRRNGAHSNLSTLFCPNPHMIYLQRERYIDTGLNTIKR